MTAGLTLCMIMRDEAELLPQCLASVTGLVDEILVVDTGSSDESPGIARGAGARVIHHPWSGSFAEARNAGLREAQGRWILILDADEALAVEDRPRVADLLMAGNVEGYLATVINFVGDQAGNNAEHSFGLRLFRNRPEYRYRGAIHETVSVPPERVRAAPVRVYHYGYLSGRIAGRQKRERNLALLEQRMADQPDDPLLLYYLATEYRAAHRDAEAVQLLRRAKPTVLGRGLLYGSKLMKNLAASLFTLNRPEEALAELADGLRHFPEFTDLVYLQGLALRSAGRLPEAIGAFHRCLAMGPASCPPYHGADPGMGGWKAEHSLARCYQERGDWEWARHHYRRAWQAGREASSLGALARLLMLRSGPGVTERELNELVCPETPAAHLLLAEALAAGRHWSGALRQIALAGRPDGDPSLKEKLQQVEALCRYHIGDAPGALAASAGAERGLSSLERAAAALASGVERPAQLIAALGAAGTRGVAMALLKAGVTALEQGLYQEPGSPALQAALAEAMQEVGQLGSAAADLPVHHRTG